MTLKNQQSSASGLMQPLKYYFYWYCFISRIIRKNTKSEFWVGAKSAAAMATAEGAWGGAGLMLIAGILKYGETIGRIYFITFITIYVLATALHIPFFLLEYEKSYNKEIDKMPLIKKKVLWAIYLFLSFAPIILCLVFAFIIQFHK